MIGSNPYPENQPFWEAVLSDGAVVCQDDGRPGENPPSAWVRLGAYLKDSGLKIVEYGLRHGALYFPLPKNKKGYFFAKGMGCLMSSSGSIHSYLLGYQEGEEVIVYNFKIPEIAVMDKSSRPVRECAPPTFLS